MTKRTRGAIASLVASLGLAASTLTVPAIAQSSFGSSDRDTGVEAPAPAPSPEEVPSDPEAGETLDVSEHTEIDPDVEGVDQFIVAYSEPRQTIQSENGESQEQSQEPPRSIIYEELYKKGANPVDETVTATGATVVKTDRKLSQQEARDFINEAEAKEEIEYVEIDQRMHINAAPNDRYYKHQWGLHGEWGAEVDEAWGEHPAQGEGEVIALVDNGVANHPDINGNIIPGYDFIRSSWSARDGDGRDADPTDEGDWYEAGECGRTRGSSSSWHGTHAAGIMAATANDGRGIAGVAPKAKILNVRVLGKCGGAMSDIADGIIWASGGYVPGAPANPNPAKIINLSLGGTGQCSRTYQNAINRAVGNGAVVVVSAGNDDEDAATAQPGNCQNVVVVGAASDEGSRAQYSNWGDTVDITAPGGDTTVGPGILSTVDAGKTTSVGYMWKRYEGTSMAAPFVSGVAALVRSVDPTLTPSQIEQLLKNTAYELATECPEGCGAGMVDAHHAILALTDPEHAGDRPAPQPAPLPDPYPWWWGW